MIISSDINKVIEFLQSQRDEGYTHVQVVGRCRKSGWENIEGEYGICILKSKAHPKVVGIDGEEEFIKYE